MRLEPGYYEIHRSNIPFGTTHYLRVFKHAGRLYYQPDNAFPKEADYFEDQFSLGRITVVRKLSRTVKTEYNDVTVSVTFTNDLGNQLEMKTNTSRGLRRVFDLFPGILSALKAQNTKPKEDQ